MYTTAALFAENRAEIDLWARDGWDAVDMETATTFAVAEHFGMTAAAVHFVFDNPLHLGDIIVNELLKDNRRAAGNELMIQASLRIVEQFLATIEIDR
jgi:purine-nucleoside phosphorylase